MSNHLGLFEQRPAGIVALWWNRVRDPAVNSLQPMTQRWSMGPTLFLGPLRASLNLLKMTGRCTLNANSRPLPKSPMRNWMLLPCFWEMTWYGLWPIEAAGPILDVADSRTIIISSHFRLHILRALTHVRITRSDPGVCP